jgi:hypothetical protein
MGTATKPHGLNPWSNLVFLLCICLFFYHHTAIEGFNLPISNCDAILVYKTERNLTNKLYVSISNLDTISRPTYSYIEGVDVKNDHLGLVK